MNIGLSDQLRQSYSKRGGYYDNYHQTKISTRDTFYVLLARFIRRQSQDKALKFFERLSRDMTSDGQVPSEYVFT